MCSSTRTGVVGALLLFQSHPRALRYHTRCICQLNFRKTGESARWRSGRRTLSLALSRQSKRLVDPRRGLTNQYRETCPSCRPERGCQKALLLPPQLTLCVLQCAVSGACLHIFRTGTYRGLSHKCSHGVLSCSFSMASFTGSRSRGQALLLPMKVQLQAA